MDVYIEDIVKKDKTTVNWLCIAGLTLALVVVLFIGLFIAMPMSFQLGAMGQIASMIVMLVIAAACYGWWYMLSRFSVEYEYTLTNSELDIDQIFGKKRRRRVTSIDFKDIELCAPITDDEFKHSSGFDRTEDLTGNNEGRTKYFVDFAREGKRIRIIINPRAKIMESAQKFNPRFIKL